MELTYTKVGDYYLPNLEAPEAAKVGKYGRMRQKYLLEHRSPIYTGMLYSGKLNSHLEEIDKQANEMMERLTKQMAQEQNVTEKLKAENQMLWVQMMNNIHSSAEEVVLRELIYQ